VSLRVIQSGSCAIFLARDRRAMILDRRRKRESEATREISSRFVFGRRRFTIIDINSDLCLSETVFRLCRIFPQNGCGYTRGGDSIFDITSPFKLGVRAGHSRVRSDKRADRRNCFQQVKPASDASALPVIALVSLSSLLRPSFNFAANPKGKKEALALFCAR